MDIKKLIQQLWRITDDVDVIEKSVIYAFFKKASLDVEGSEYFSRYFDNYDVECGKKAVVLFNSPNIENQVSIYTLVEIFEHLVPQEQRKGKGVVYTPTNIKDYIISSTIVSETIPYICDPACGCGSFLISAAEYMHQKYDISYSEIFSTYIFGVDIDAHAIEKAKLLFHVLAYLSGETLDEMFQLICGDTLDPIVFKKIYSTLPDGFDYVIGNPPYVRARNMNNEVRNNLKNWETAKSGNVDLYLPFYEIGLKLLKPNGKLGYISPNTFLQSVNGRSLRQYLKELDISILDFRETQIFKNVTSYTCIVLIDKGNNARKIHYALLNGKSSLFDYNFTEYDVSDFPNGAPWRMCTSSIDVALRKMESAGIKLDNFKIRNGLATLKNDAYFFTPTDCDDAYYYREYLGKTYRIEKAICIDVIKPNTLKSEGDLALQMEKAIFPYNLVGSAFSVIEECDLKEMYPSTYAFFLDIKAILLKRDKGQGKYPEWFAYGRSQGITNWGKKLLIPYIAEVPTAVISLQEDVLFYCGYAIFSDDDSELMVLKRFLESSAFWYYIKHTSKPYAKGYMALAKNYIKNFSIPILTEEQKIYVLQENDLCRLDSWIWSLYELEEYYETLRKNY